MTHSINMKRWQQQGDYGNSIEWNCRCRSFQFSTDYVDKWRAFTSHIHWIVNTNWGYRNTHTHTFYALKLLGCKQEVRFSTWFGKFKHGFFFIGGNVYENRDGYKVFKCLLLHIAENVWQIRCFKLLEILDRFHLSALNICNRINSMYLNVE